MIKKYTLLSLGVLAALASQARTLTPEEALARFTADRSALRVAGASAVAAPKLVHTTSGESGAPVAYVFDRPQGGGFMVLSADDAAAPLLGYGDEQVTDSTPMPEQLVWWLGEYAREIEAASEAPQQRVDMSSFDAPATAAADRAPIAPLITTKWNQDGPYNNLCPQISGQYTYTGCVATAMAQVMKYHNYPEKGNGTGSCTVTNVLGAQVGSYDMNLAVDLDWDNMIDSYAGNYTTAQAEAVATLMKACGYSVNMDYSTSASGAQSNAVAVALVDNFGYDKAITYVERMMYPLSTWEDMVYDNLKNCGPVYYSGQALAGGHAFVCDGYSSDGYFHFNWGWGGAYDGYFRLTALEPAGQGIGGFSGGYNSGQAALFGVRKPVAGSELPALRLTQVAAITASDDASRVTLSGGWANYNGRSMNVAIALDCTPVPGSTPTRIQVYTYSECPTFKGFSSMTIRKSDFAKLSDGTYKVSVVTQNQGSSDWLEVWHPVNMPDYILMNKSGGVLTFTTQEAAALTCVSAELLTPVYYDAAGKLTMTLRNDATVEVPANVALAMLGGSSVVARTESVLVDLVPGASQSVDMEFTFVTSSDFTKGASYTLALVDVNTGAVLKDFGTVKASSAPAATLTCDNFRIVGSSTAAILDDLQFTGSFTNNSTGYYGNIMGIAMFPSNGGNNLASFDGDIVYLAAGETERVNFKVDFSNIGTIDTYYLAVPFYLKSNFIGTLAATTFEGDPVVRFKATAYSGIAAVADDEAELRVYYNNAIHAAIVNSGAEIQSVEVAGMSGAMLQVPVSINGCTATVDLSSVPAGIVVVRAVDADGCSVATKLMVR